jgi:hypothetical protein
MSHRRRQTPAPLDLPPDPVIEAYKEGIDMSLVRENLKLTPDQRIRRMLRFIEDAEKIRGAARRGR